MNVKKSSHKSENPSPKEKITSSKKCPAKDSFLICENQGVLNFLFLTLFLQTYSGKISADRRQEKYIKTEFG
jgi:hypothetical protein